MTKQVLPEAYDAGNDDGAGYSYTYDCAGRLTQIQDPGRKCTAYLYLQRSRSDHPGDGWGRTGDAVCLQWSGTAYKSADQHPQEGDTTYYRVTAYTYDRAGNKMEEAYGQQEVEKDKNPDSWHRIHFSYDQNSHLVLVKDEFGAQMHYEYDCLGNVILEEHLIEEGYSTEPAAATTKTAGWFRKQSISKATAKSTKLLPAMAMMPTEI